MWWGMDLKHPVLLVCNVQGERAMDEAARVRPRRALKVTVEIMAKGKSWPKENHGQGIRPSYEDTRNALEDSEGECNGSTFIV